MSANMIFIFI